MDALEITDGVVISGSVVGGLILGWRIIKDAPSAIKNIREIVSASKNIVRWYYNKKRKFSDDFFFYFMRKSIKDIPTRRIAESLGKQKLFCKLAQLKYQCFYEELFKLAEDADHGKIEAKTASDKRTHAEIFMRADARWQKEFREYLIEQGWKKAKIEYVIEQFMYWHKPHIDMTGHFLELFDGSFHDMMNAWQMGFFATNKDLEITAKNINGKLTGLTIDGVKI